MWKRLKANFLRAETWRHGGSIVLFAWLYTVGELVLFVIVVVQFIATLLIGRPSRRLLGVARALAQWLYQVLLFMSFNRRTRPWPIDRGPDRSTTRIKRQSGAEEG